MDAAFSPPLDAVTYGLLTYGLLGAAVVALLARARRLSIGAAALALAAACVGGIASWLAVLALAVFLGLCLCHFRLPREDARPAMRGALMVSGIAVMGVAIAFGYHVVPGFENVKALDRVVLSPGAAPFTMYLNFDKVFAAVMLALAGGFFPPRFEVRPRRIAAVGTLMLGAAVLVVIPAGLAAGQIAFEPKIIDAFWLWLANNLLFVVFAEEVIFRGMLQGSLVRLCSHVGWPPLLGVAVGAGLFGLYHLPAGWAFVGLAAVTGLIYGYAFFKTRSLEAAIAVHFLVNLVHVLLFTYPRLA